MREILFKAKRLSDGEWFEGVPVDVTPLVCFASDKVAQEVVMVRAGFADWGMPRGMEYTKVDPSTVCQYTGLTDKNGKKIFEWDIIRWTNWRGEQKEAPVCYDPEWNRFCVWLNGAESMGVNKQLSTSGIEIIGNVHDGEGGQHERDA